MGTKIQIAEPSEIFKPFIRYYKYLEADIAGVLKVVPNTFVELYFNFTHINLFSPGNYDLDNPKIHLTGLHQYEQNIFTHMYGTGRNGGLAIVFQPHGFYDLFNVKSSDFCNYAINGDLVFKMDIYDLWEELQPLHNVENMKRLVENYFYDYAETASHKSAITNDIVNFMDHSKGMIRVSQICDKFNVTPRSLHRHFREEIGITPKEMLNIFRINNAIKLITDNPQSDLTGISYLSGYYDQSHFIKEIRKITGISPGHIRGGDSTKVSTFHNLSFIKKD